jgi:hypothetical protein
MAIRAKGRHSLQFLIESSCSSGGIWELPAWQNPCPLLTNRMACPLLREGYSWPLRPGGVLDSSCKKGFLLNPTEAPANKGPQRALVKVRVRMPVS